MKSSYFYGITAGLLGALASTFGKLIFEKEKFFTISLLISKAIHYIAGQSMEEFSQDELQIIEIAVFVMQGCCLALTVALNALMWSTFIDALQKLTSAEAVVLNTGSNIVISGCIGMLLFNEKISLIWWTGACLIVFGMAVIQTESHNLALKKK